MQGKPPVDLSKIDPLRLDHPNCLALHREIAYRAHSQTVCSQL